MLIVKFVDSEFGASVVSEYDMCSDSVYVSESAAEARRKEIQDEDPGARAWIFEA